MTKQLLVRNVPQELQEWIDREREQHQMSKQEFVLSLLQKASSLTPHTLPLEFEQVTNARVLHDPPIAVIDKICR